MNVKIGKQLFMYTAMINVTYLILFCSDNYLKRISNNYIFR